jgi:hypothetical protein
MGEGIKGIDSCIQNTKAGLKEARWLDVLTK